MKKWDALLDVFLSNVKKDVFHSVEHRHQIWREDPFDVESVHEQARAQFQRMLTQATTPPGLDSGRILLLLGDSGSGKTHLVRAFRNYVHVNGLGFVGYMQMTTATASYSRYLVSNLIDSLDQTYYESLGTSSGLLRLSNAVAARCGDAVAIRSLSDNADLDANAVIELVERAADGLIAHPRYADLDLDLIRALLFLQRQDPALKKRVVKYLRCEVLSERDQKLLGELSPKSSEEDAQKRIEQLGRLMWAFDSRSLVICVDQFEDVYRVEDAEALFRRVMSSLCAVADQVPSSIIVIACLNDYYKMLRARLTRSTLDRIENDPPPMRLVAERTGEDVEKIIQQRLGYLYETSRVKPEEGAVAPLYPFPRDFVQRIAGLRIRDVLDECHKFREACIEAGQIVNPKHPTSPVRPPPVVAEAHRVQAAKERLEQEWNDYLAQYQEEPPESDAQIADLFRWAIATCADELEGAHRFDAHVKGEAIEIRIMVPNANGGYRLGEEILVGICNRAPQGGRLRAQFETVLKRAEHRIPALVRCGEFPSNPNTVVRKALADIIKNGGRKAVVEESDWRQIAAFQRFRHEHGRRDHFMAWLMEENHLSRLLPLIHVLDLDRLDRFEQETVPRSAVSASGDRPSKLDEPVERDGPRAAKNGSTPPRAPERSMSAEAGALTLGTTGELIAQELTFDAEAITAHAAFLGSTGSGKTTLALNVVEQLLLRGIPAILVDRKGDLCAYARESLWVDAHPDPEIDARRRRLRDRLDIALFTPGHADGRQLALSLVPRGLGALKDVDREQAATHAARALGDMLGYKNTRKDKALRAILVQAFQLFATHGVSDNLDIESLIEFIANEDRELVAALGRLDTRLFKDLVHDLEVLKLGSADLLCGAAEKLDAEVLLGLGAHAVPGRTRLSIVSTRFLGDNARILFWISQMLLALTRWVTRQPSPRLQAVVLFDEADMYLPAQSQPATKAPMENLLRRARSGGLGILLATQSPGDLDYKCRDNLRSWFVGRVTQTVALEKMKPLLSEARVNVAARIPGQSVGEFHLLQEGRVTSFKGSRPLLRAEQVPESEILNLAAMRRHRASG